MELRARLEVVGVEEPSDFANLKIVAERADHLFVTRDELAGLAGPLADDPDWLTGLDKMFAFAQARGWTDERGAVRAHVEWR